MKALTIAASALLVVFSVVQAEAIATLHIGPGYGDPCAMGCGGDPNTFNGTSLDIYQTSGGAQPITNLMLILAVPNFAADLSTFSATIASMAYNAEATAPLSNSISSTYQGNLTSGDVYTFLSLSGNKSPSFVNFVQTETAASGKTPTAYGIYTFDLTNITLDANGIVDINFLSGLPSGTIALAWGDPVGPYYETPYTEAARVPEPSTLLLLGSGLLGLGGFAWRRNRKG